MNEKMNPKIKDQWIAALRGGEYKQGRHQLAYTDPSGVTSYCCLGVLCDLAVKAGVITSAPVDSDGSGAYDGAFYSLPDSAMEWSGIETSGGEFGYDSLVGANDTGSSFSIIADIIEREF